MSMAYPDSLAVDYAHTRKGYLIEGWLLFRVAR